MKTYVCWVCMRDFSTSKGLVKHVTSQPHLELVLRQALGKDTGAEGQKRHEKRKILAGVDDVPDDEQYEEETCRRTSTVAFCRCILGWKVGACDACSKRAPDAAALHKQIFASVIEAQKVRMDMEERQNKLGMGLSKMLGQSDYDPLKNKKKLKADEKLGPRMVLRYIMHQINRKVRMPDPEVRKRSPLVSSAVRKQSMAKVHVGFGRSVTNPALLVKVPTDKAQEISRQLSRRMTSTALPNPEEVSLLLPSHQRKSVVSVGDNLEAFRDRAASSLGPSMRNLGPMARRSTLRLPIAPAGSSQNVLRTNLNAQPSLLGMKFMEEAAPPVLLASNQEAQPGP